MSKASQALSRTFGLVVPNRITEGITHRQLAVLLREAASEAESIALFYTDGINSMSQQIRGMQFRQVTGGLRGVSTELWNGTGRIIKAGEYTMADIAAEQSLDLSLLSGLPQNAVDQLVPYLHYEAAQAVDDIISHRTNGFTLADRIYANGRVSTKQVGRIVDKALAQQLSAKELAKQVRGFYHPDVPGGSSYAAMRLARTEINNAHHHTTMRLSQNMPWVTGFKWNLSSSHPKPDECDVLAGRGMFKKDDPPSRPHPQCLCYVTHMYVDDEEFASNIVNGKYDKYMEDRGVTC